MRDGGTRRSAYLALGSNLGDRLRNLRQALAFLREVEGIEIVAVSSVYETAPVGGPPDQEDYYNAVVAVRSSLPAHALLRRCLEIESRMGRRRTTPNAPRIIDLDVLMIDQEVVSEDEIEVPHPRMHEREFVLRPLAEIAPGVHHPTCGKTADELLSDVHGGGVGVRRAFPRGWEKG